MSSPNHPRRVSGAMRRPRAMPDLSPAAQALMEASEPVPAAGGDAQGKKAVPVYVMMPPDIVALNRRANEENAMSERLQELKKEGVEGITVDVWWGLVEGERPGQYNWSGYLELLEAAEKCDLKVRPTLSFHLCGGENLSDFHAISLPKWVVEEIDKDTDLAYTDIWGRRNYEYVSLGCDTLPVLQGRTPVQCYEDFMRSFKDTFEYLLGGTIVEIQVGMGPTGVLRYPSYPEQNGAWKFSQTGAFQCYDKYMLSSLKAAAEAIGKQEWGHTGPTNYNNWLEYTNFFQKGSGQGNNLYGEFFLSWYSRMLIDHSKRILQSARSIFENKSVKISIKIIDIHWDDSSQFHASELAAGYFHTYYHDGYLPITQMMARHGALLNFSCFETRSHEPQDTLCERIMNHDLFQMDNWMHFMEFMMKMLKRNDTHWCWEQVESGAEHFVHIRPDLSMVVEVLISKPITREDLKNRQYMVLRALQGKKLQRVVQGKRVQRVGQGKGVPVLRSPEVEIDRVSPSLHSSSVHRGMRPNLLVAAQTLMSDWRTSEDLKDRQYVIGGGAAQGKENKKGVPVYVMMPLDSVMCSHLVNRKKAMNSSLQVLKSAGVEGIMMDVWWGLVEGEKPDEYNWGGYAELLEMAKKHGLKVQAVMSFHQCGGNVEDSCTIPLPKWVVEEIDEDPDLAYTDQWGRRNYEYISLGCDMLPVLKGRTPVQCYADFMSAFKDSFEHLLGDTIVEIQVGMGPSGELRYPSCPEQNGTWKFPGIGAFQCFDKYMLSSLKAAAEDTGILEWEQIGVPTGAGHYNSWPEDTNFFRREGGGWSSPYGEFFLSWYSQMLLDHGERILQAATSIFVHEGVEISVKIAGIHWHYGTRSHAPELTAGYYNTRYNDGYLPIAQMLASHGAVFRFTCMEMRDHEQPQDALCAPEKLVRQVASATQRAQVPLAGENAVLRYDEYAHEQILQTSALDVDNNSGNWEMRSFTYRRMNPNLFQPDNWRRFVAFVKKMKEAKDVRVRRCWEQVEREAEHFVHLTQPLVQEAAVELMH